MGNVLIILEIILAFIAHNKCEYLPYRGEGRKKSSKKIKRYMTVLITFSVLNYFFNYMHNAGDELIMMAMLVAMPVIVWIHVKLPKEITEWDDIAEQARVEKEAERFFEDWGEIG